MNKEAILYVIDEGYATFFMTECSRGLNHAQIAANEVDILDTNFYKEKTR